MKTAVLILFIHLNPHPVTVTQYYESLTDCQQALDNLYIKYTTTTLAPPPITATCKELEGHKT
jgi:hypothetical protein